MAKSLKVEFDFEKDTPGTRRFKEVPARGKDPVVGTLYLKNAAVATLEQPEHLSVTITVVEPE